MQDLAKTIELIQPILSNFPYYLNTVIEVIGAITVIASVVVKLTKTPDDDIALSNFKLKIHKFLAWLPTVGYNPHQDVVTKFEDEKKV